MVKAFIRKVARLGGVDIKRYDKSLDRFTRLYQKYRQFTMVHEAKFLMNLELVGRYAGVSGDFAECGVWKGGMAAAISEILGEGKRIHLFDSFEGLPPAKEIDGKEAIAWQADKESPQYHDNCKADESLAREALKLAGHSNFRIYPGWFSDTLKNFDGKRIGILRLDADWYDSTMTCLLQLYPLVTEGGIVILDDYYVWDGCSRAVHDYLALTKSPGRLHQSNNSQVAFIVKKN